MKKAFSFAIILVAAAIAVAVVSCKKDTQNATSNPQNQSVQTFDPSHITDMNAYLKDFKKKMQTSAERKDGETLSIEEAAWHLSSVANYDFANANVQYTDLRYDTLQYQVNVTNGQVLLSDLEEVYESMASDIDAFYQSLDLQEKHFRFIGASVSEDGQVRVSLITSYIVLDHTWYFEDDWDALMNCSYWFDDNTSYVWNTTAVHALNQALNAIEGQVYSEPEAPPQRAFYVYTQDVVFNYESYIDPYGSSFIYNSRIFSYECGASSGPTLVFNDMCYCLDSYLGLPFEYAATHVGMENQRPVSWNVKGFQIPPLPGFKWDIYYHVIRVKFGIRVVSEDPNQY